MSFPLISIYSTDHAMFRLSLQFSDIFKIWFLIHLCLIITHHDISNPPTPIKKLNSSKSDMTQSDQTIRMNRFVISSALHDEKHDQQMFMIIILICLFISVSLLAKWWLFTCGLSSRVSSIGNVSNPGMTADLTRAQRSVRFIQNQKSQCYNVDLRFIPDKSTPTRIRPQTRKSRLLLPADWLRRHW